ncbi:MAG: hypothetical protein ACI9HK_002416 [Pirellulaceae bacterium]|jgi:hypothetical protein
MAIRSTGEYCGRRCGGTDAGVPDATPVERLMMVWPLTLSAWAFKEPNVAQPRLQRHVVRTIRNRS